MLIAHVILGCKSGTEGARLRVQVTVGIYLRRHGCCKTALVSRPFGSFIVRKLWDWLLNSNTSARCSYTGSLSPEWTKQVTRNGSLVYYTGVVEDCLEEEFYKCM